MSELRLMTHADLPVVMDIIKQAQAYLAAQGIDQWQNGYPDEEAMRNDIALSQGYVLEWDGHIAACVTIAFDREPSYDTIVDGQWNTPELYACIHRLAVDARFRGMGVSDAVMTASEALVRARSVPGIRVDTHRQNIVMQRMLIRNGYSRCGVIYLPKEIDNGAERIAFDKRI